MEDSKYIYIDLSICIMTIRIVTIITIPTNMHIIVKTLENNIHVSQVHCRSAVRFGQALPGCLITAHHLYVFLM